MVDGKAKKKSGCSCGTILLTLIVLALVVIGILGFGGYKLFKSSVAMVEASTVPESSLVDAWKQTEADLSQGLGKTVVTKIISFFAGNSAPEPMFLTPTELQLALGEVLKVQLGDKSETLRFSLSASGDVLTAKISLPLTLLSEFGIGNQLISEELVKKFFEPTIEFQARVREGQPYLAVHAISIPANPELAKKLQDTFAGDNLISMQQDQDLRKSAEQIESLEIENGTIKIVKRVVTAK
jgi:hypothetical protein